MIKNIKAVILAIVLALSNFNTVIYAYQVNDETRDIEVLETEKNQVNEESEDLETEENQVDEESEDIDDLETEENQVDEESEDIEDLETEENQVDDENEETYALKYPVKDETRGKGIYVLKTKINNKTDVKTIMNTYQGKKSKELQKEVAYTGLVTNNKYKKALENVSKIYDYFDKNFKIKGIDGKGLVPYILPNYTENQSSFFASDNRDYVDENVYAPMISLGEEYSDKTNQKSTKKSAAYYKDIIAHEYTHGLLNYKYKLTRNDKQSITIHEALADFFACIIDGNWTIADDPSLIKVTSKNQYRRNIAKPGEGYVSHYSKIQSSNNVYKNSTLISHLLYLIATGKNISGNGIGKNETAKLTLRAIESLPIKKGDGWRYATIETFAGALLKKAYSKEKDTVINALKQVGIFDVVKTPVTSVKLNKTSTTIIKGKGEKLTATINPSNASDKNIIWKSSDTKVAKVDSNGNITAVKPGTSTITVTTRDGNKKATCKVTVKIPVTSVKLNKTSTTIKKGKSEKLTATINPSNATNKNVTWKSSNTKIATVDTKGNVKAVTPGKAIITVTTKDGNKTVSCNVTIK